MVLNVSLPKKLSFDEASNPSSPEFVVLSPATSNGISNIVSEILTAQKSHASEKNPIPKTIPLHNNRRDLENEVECLREPKRSKMGSRRRKRYENASFLNVPNSQPPLPSDWEVYPTYPVYHNVPYYLAPLWNSKFQRIAEERARCKSSPPRGKISQDFKLALKKGLAENNQLQHLEYEIRRFIQHARDNHTARATCYSQGEIDTEDEEIVLIERDEDGQGIIMSDEADKATLQNLQIDELIFDNMPQDGGGFVRWLIHELAQYYGLKSLSENRECENGNNKKTIRIVRVGFGDLVKDGFLRNSTNPRVDDELFHLPRPLWGLV